MGQIKNIKLHIVTDIKCSQYIVSKWRKQSQLLLVHLKPRKMLLKGNSRRPSLRFAHLSTSDDQRPLPCLEVVCTHANPHPRVVGWTSFRLFTIPSRLKVP